MDPTETDAGCWPLATVARTGKPELVSDLTSRFGRLPGGSWPEPAVQALVLPIAATGRGGLAGFFVVGVSPRRALDDDYRAFFELTAGQVATAVANARAAGREEALHLLAAIVESSEDAIIGMNLNGTITSWNNGAERLFGSKTEEMVGHSISEIIPPERSDELHKILRQIGRGQHVEHFETIRRRKDNSLVPVSLTVSAVRDASGKIMGASKIARDVTERKRAEEALRQSEADLKLALDGGSLGEWKWEIATDKVSWSPLCKALYGLPPDADMNYERFLAAVHPDDRERVAAALQRAVETRTDYEQEKRIVWPDGSVHWNAARGRVYCDAGGQPLRMAGVTMDVTERTRAEEALRRSEAYLAEAQRLSHTGSWAWNVARREFVHWSLEHYHIHGLDPDRGIPSWEAAQQFIHPEDRARCLEGIERAIRERANCDLDYRAVLPDGALKFIHSIGHPVFNAAGELVEFVGTEMDVTERKRAEEALRQSHALLNAVAEGTSDAVFVKDLQGRYLMINTAGARFLGKTVNEVVGKDDRELFSPETARAIMERDRSVLAAGESQTEEEIGTAAGVTRTYLTMKGVYRDPQGQVIGLIGIARDITERKRADESLRRSEEMLLRAQVIGHIGSWVFDVRDGVFSGSEEGYRMCGWGPGSHRGEELLAIVHPDDLPRMQTAWLATMAGARTKLSIGWWSMASLNG